MEGVWLPSSSHPVLWCEASAPVLEVGRGGGCSMALVPHTLDAGPGGCTRPSEIGLSCVPGGEFDPWVRSALSCLAWQTICSEDVLHSVAQASCVCLVTEHLHGGTVGKLALIFSKPQSL